MSTTCSITRNSGIAAVAWLTCIVASHAADPPPLPPQESLATMQTRPGFTIELVAAEPLVMDPVAIEWDARGRLWVVEMADYPLGLDDRGKPGGRVRILTDTDRDGRYDRSTLFLDGLRFPTDLMPWRNGVLITAAPQILFSADTDGDDRADVTEVLYEGFGEGNQQHRVNGLRWGLDNALYVANGDSGGLIRSVKTGVTLEIRGRDLKIEPDRGTLEALAGQSQYGRNRDDWGSWFGNNNSTPMWHYAIEDRYLRRNPHAAPAGARFTIARNDGVFAVSRVISHWRAYRPVESGRASPFTSACSPMIYRDDRFELGDETRAFISEPVHNLVHRRVLRPQGSTFVAERAQGEEQTEFLASRDSWFRPTTLRTGPDGALWIADMYRLVLEHPQYIDPAVLKTLDLRAGHDKGRIYRVFRTAQPPRPIPDLAALTTPELVAQLDSPSGWQRDTVQRLLLERNDPAAELVLRELAASGSRPQARLHALATLDGLGRLRDAEIITALSDAHPGVRRHALRLAEARLVSESAEPQSALFDAVFALHSERDPQARLQWLLTLGACRDARAAPHLARQALRSAADPTHFAAVVTSLRADNVAAVAFGLLDEAQDVALSAATLEPILQTLAATESAATITRVLERLARLERPDQLEAKLASMAVVCDVVQRRPRLATELDKCGASAAIEATAIEVRKLARDVESRTSLRTAAIRLLARSDTAVATDGPAIFALLSSREAPEIQAAALAAAVRLPADATADELLRSFSQYTPAVRALVLDALLAEPRLVDRLLAALEAKRLAVGNVDAARRDRLLNDRDPARRERAVKIFTAAGDPSRAAILASYSGVPVLAGDRSRGKLLFGKSCGACHRLEDVGNAVGPNLAEFKDKSPQAILIAVLDPNRAVETRYANFTAVTTEGVTYSGILVEETATSVTLASPDGKRHALLRNQLDELTSGGKSFMPEGLERDLPPQALADVISFVLSAGTAPAK